MSAGGPEPRADAGPAALTGFGGAKAVVLSGSSRVNDAVAACRRLGLEPVLALSRQDLMSGPRILRDRVAASDGAVAALYTEDWDRQEMPQLLLLATLLANVPGPRLLIERSPAGAVSVRVLSRRVMWSLPGDVVRGVFSVAREAMVECLAPLPLWEAAAQPDSRPDSTAAPTILAVWLGESGIRVGGSVTHMSGILGGFRESGFKIALLAGGSVPEQLREVVDVIRLTEPLPPAARLTTDVERIATNRAVRTEVAGLAAQLRPAFIYQRHRPFLTAPLAVAQKTDLPLVLEWNSSEVWTRKFWNSTARLELVFDPLLAHMERRVVREADMIVAVSEAAADMARGAGAPDERVVVVPNAVAADDIVSLADRTRGAQGRMRIGWIGSFGPWHGAPVLIRALALLPDCAEAVMIGDGQELPMCRRLAHELGVAERIQWAGVLEHEDAVRVLSGCDVLASPHVSVRGQRFFGSPTKIFEYMAIGRPIVASALEQIAEVLEDGVTARLVAPGDAAALATAVVEILESPDRGAALGGAARAAAVARHMWSHRAATILSALGLAGSHHAIPARDYGRHAALV